MSGDRGEGYASLEDYEKDDAAIETVYIPSHLNHILFELFKNAIRATIETYGEEAKKFPKIKVKMSSALGYGNE